MSNQQAHLEVREQAGIERRGWPVSRGVPLPEGAVRDCAELWLEDAAGTGVASQFRPLAKWADGSIKWVLTDFQADVAAKGQETYQLKWGEKRESLAGAERLEIESDEERIVVCTGPLRFGINRREFSLFEFAQLGLRDGAGHFCALSDVGGEGGEAWANICESFTSKEGKRRIYGMGGKCRASLGQEEYKVEVEEAGPLRAVIRCEGAFEADVPMHHYAGYRPLRFVVRIYAYAGQAFVRVLHTVVVAFNPRETEVEEIGVRIPVNLPGPVQYRLGGVRPEGGVLAGDEYLLLSQKEDNHYQLEHRQGLECRQVAEGERVPGWLTVEAEGGGVGVALRHMAEEYPKALGAGGNGAGIDVFLWRDPAGGRLSCRRYSEDVAWDAGEGVFADGTGTAKTSEFFVAFYRGESSEEMPTLLAGLLQGPQVKVDPTWMAHCQAMGGFAPATADAFPASERMMQGFAQWAARSVALGRWYGFFDWGDMLVAFEEEDNDWRFFGRWGWCNSEWDPRHGVWIHYMRTGQGEYFDLGEAMTRHSTDVDTCHFHPFRPYMVGACFRHSVDHFGDEPCASHTFIDNWVDYYYLSGDLRTLEVLREAGRFFMRYRWSEDPAFSFSLRSISNTLRGLLYLWEITGEESYRSRAEEVYDAIARGQNEDGSWHKRFQISTADRLPDQGPYMMATEGSTLAVEMGTAPPFTAEEYRQLRGEGVPLVRVLPKEEQKGYQTHYLMVGLELMHRQTGRGDVAEVYRRAVDWFCGHPDALSGQRAIGQSYGGVICRHLAYAYQLTGERKYLEMGREVLHHLIGTQDWSDDPRRHGAVGLSPMYLSLHFFGVPYLVGVMQEAGMDEGEVGGVS